MRPCGVEGMRLRAGAATALVAAFSLPHASPAGADYDPIRSGTTGLALDQRFLAFAKRHGIAIEARSSAGRQGRRLVVPAVGGRFDPTIGKGTVLHGGTIVFRHGRRSLPWRRLEVKAKRTPLEAKVGGGKLKVATARSVEARRDGFGSVMAARGLRLTAKVAARLNKKLGLRSRPFAAGQPFASLRTTVEPLTATVLPQGRATIDLDPAFVAKADSLFVSINPVSPTELTPGSRQLTVPIVRKGAIAPDASVGALRTSGGIELLQQGAGQVFVAELWFDLGTRIALAELSIRPTPTFPGALGQLPSFAIGPFAATADARERTVAVSGAPLTLGESATAALNRAFGGGWTQFVPGDPFGRLSFVAETQ